MPSNVEAYTTASSDGMYTAHENCFMFAYVWLDDSGSQTTSYKVIRKDGTEKSVVIYGKKDWSSGNRLWTISAYLSKGEKVGFDCTKWGTMPTFYAMEFQFT